MYLREVFFHGFKSFADPIKLSLDPGVSAIVGPNGCGKSNIADAIRWVLGEQSPKALRGGKMQDVIFSGTDARKPITVCEVSLTFTNCEEELGSAFHEVEISRKVARDGASGYFINGKASRLRDVQRLFMDTGIGRVSYSFLVQGQVDQILSSNPVDRRIIFEEAAGITKYKTQRREALNKLALVDQNLSRVTDVIDEVGRQIGSLKRQAGKALRYKRLKHRHTHLELASFAYRHGNLARTLSELQSRDKDLNLVIGEAKTRVAEGEEKLEKVRSRRNEAFSELQEAQEQLYALRSEKETAENTAQFARIRIEDLNGRARRLSDQEKELVTAIEEVNQQKVQEAEDREAHLSQVGSSDEHFREHSEALAKAEEELRRAEARHRDARRDILALENDQSRCLNEATRMEIDLRAFESRGTDLREAIGELGTRLKEEETSLEKAEVKLNEQREERERAQKELSVTQEQAEAAKKKFRGCTEAVTIAERTLTQSQARLNALIDLEEKLEGFGEGTRALLKGELGGGINSARFRPLVQSLETAPEHVRAIEALIGEAADLLLAEDPDEALLALETLSDRKLGRACLQLPIGLDSPPCFPLAEDLPEGTRPAIDLVTCTDSSIQASLERVLEGCYVVDSLKEAVRWVRERPDFRFRAMASIEGDSLDQRRILAGGRGKGKGKSGGQMQRQNEIRALRSEIREREQEVVKLKATAQEALKASDAAEETHEKAREARAKAEQTVGTSEAALSTLRDRVNQIQAELDQSNRNLEKLSRDRTEAQSRLDEAQKNKASAETRWKKKKDEIAELEAATEKLRDKRDECREGLANVRLDLAEKRQRLDLLEKTLLSRKQKVEELESRRDQIQQELDHIQTQKAEAEKEIATSEEKATALGQSLQSVSETASEKRRQLESIDSETEELEATVRKSREHRQKLEAERNSVEVQLAREQSQLHFIDEKVQSEHQRSLSEIDWKMELWAADEPFQTRINIDDLEEGEVPDLKTRGERGDPTPEELEAMEATPWEEVDAEIHQLRDRINSMGAVNLVAIEEYADLRQRHEFLLAQSQDLRQSKEELVRAIDEINQTSQTLFQQTFEQVRKNFQYTYDRLTDGGKADLNLAESEDVLEAGIDILARPPGTRLSQISLLSGGQRTMAAVALLFAIYMVKPSPFCFLDELDAPLDDANIGRFTEMLRDFTKFSQFLIITHNKRTIGSADAVFGVTMQEKGISKLVSMRFNHETQKAEFAEEAS